MDCSPPLSWRSKKAVRKHFPVWLHLFLFFTLVAYFFIGETRGGQAVSQHAKFVLVGTLISWVPYMLAVAYLSPKIAPHKAILVGLIIFFILALIYIAVANRFGFFK